MLWNWVALIAGAVSVSSHATHHAEDTFSQERLDELERKWGTDWSFSGISTFAHLPHTRCLTHPETTYDIAILGAPFDTAVSYRPGARFGPRAIRAGSARQTSFRGFNPRANLNPYTSWAKIIDCGDIPITPFDNVLALKQMSEAFMELGKRPATEKSAESGVQYLKKPKLLTLGGDHSIALPALRALKEVYGQPIAVVHFDAHLDTWHPAKYPSAWLDESSLSFNHGSMFWVASTEGLIANGSSVHAGLRTRLSGDGPEDYTDDSQQGWHRISTDDLDDIGVKGVISSIMDRVGTETLVYLSIDIDVIDPGMAPGTGTPEPGGWTTRELIRILRGIEGMNVIGADIVEVSPAYDGAAETTGLAAAQVAYEVLTSMVRKGLIEQARTKVKTSDEKDEL
ncbi:SpeB Arginase agmatinase formimionoglutamate hydrolase arginase family [Pyrenophora tritici-repentis]|uniref:agmatinase n=2 Tax=Pyrenophora tritici-repentis TaxID=45151 RepID=A0A2W1FJZ2_9PLEO|nr:agmatinase, mitochondrial precursor [Pyrenophora tritici-repentis Pt-1C-BFP]KAA8625572.1 Agmatinase mitochondrial [Pyrenophora tritici-repentis]EDU40382.1 agmatinase, mitochondrial precursor [Pyrenophora tritici-repentis Pt-1C-BFP]KAF7453981.1 Agmatinase mitochondrial [Pyrenophora tritici-repentis]KAF7577073.1 SpeB, Arginase-agmatinase-formimionoglutamate hydrolase, arginase family [Pyrenophora tritici-repentis]KAG9387731.1 Agmatinase mitochondrial [Pyrenophora tritici-repentis]